MRDKAGSSGEGMHYILLPFLNKETAEEVLAKMAWLGVVADGPFLDLYYKRELERRERDD